MPSLIHFVQDTCSHAIHSAFSMEKTYASFALAEVTQSTQLQFGHYQCNSALKIGKELKCPPRQAAEKIVEELKKSDIFHQVFEKIEIAGPGFINITLSSSYLSKLVNDLLNDERLGVPRPQKKERVIVEFSSPNIAKELHVGHLRSTIIGDALARLFEFLGEDVLRLNHVGDFGTQFGMLIAYMQEEVEDIFLGKRDADLSELMQWYKQAKKRFDEDEAFKKRSQLEVVRLQSGEKKAREAWQKICEISRKCFQEIYSLLDVHLLERGESFYENDLPVVVADLEKKGIITVSDGAKCIFIDGFVNRDNTPLPMIVQKSDGGYNYATTDLAAMRHRIQVEKAERIIVVTDAGQSLHFEMLEKAAQKAGYLDLKKVRFDHVPFGVVLGPDGKKFKTRSGETEKLIDLLQGGIDRAKEILKERLPDLSMEELNQMAQILGIDAIKYADLSGHRIKDYVFSYDRMLKLEGNTAAFLLYSYVRIQGIKRKVNKEISSLLSKTTLHLTHPSEIILGLHLCQFAEILQMMSRDLLPHRLCEYLYHLAELFNAFFRDCRVEGDLEEESRLLLCEATGRVLKQGLWILGLKTLDKM